MKVSNRPTSSQANEKSSQEKGVGLHFKHNIRTCDHTFVHKGGTHQNISISRDAIPRENFQHIPSLHQIEGDQFGHFGGVISVIRVICGGGISSGVFFVIVDVRLHHQQSLYE